jgi:serine/threonine-protein kinase
MATVYLATDLKHGRAVALKMLLEPLSGALGAERFLREIAVTAQLDHPHVVPLLDSGEADGDLFYVMPYVEGESLRDRMQRDKQLPLAEALTIAREVLDALEYAHGRGIIHRDIKPENILLSNGHARVADFGIARAVVASAGSTLTGTGIALGTPHYMSPEQGVADREIDRRSDIYAVGCVLFEMLAGQPPFSGPTMESLVHQHLLAPPPPVTQLRPLVPASISGAIGRALAKAPADRFESAALFASALATGEIPIGGVATPTPGASHPMRTHALVVAAALAVIALAVAFAIPRMRRAADAKERPLVAVLPFRNLGEPGDAYFADGVTEEITARLARISAIRVISRTTSMHFRETTRSLRDIARELGVEYVLEGTIRTERLPNGTGQVRVTPDLVRAADDSHLWTDVYTAGLAPGEIFAVQSRIAERVAEAFHVSLLTPEVSAVRQHETADSGAYRATLLGRFQLAKGTPAAVREAIAHFEHAAALDPRYARPLAGLTAAYLRLPYFPNSWMPIPEAFAKAEDAARRALALDVNSAGAHAALGEVLELGRWDWAGAEREARQAVLLDPDYVDAHRILSSVLEQRDRPDEALREAERALELAPTDPGRRTALADRLRTVGREGEAVAQLNEALRLEPENVSPHITLADIHGTHGDLAKMADELELLRNTPRLVQGLRDWVRGSGAKAVVIREIDAIATPNPGLDAARKAWLFANIGEHTRSIDALELSVSSRAPSAISVLRMPSAVKALASEPRYRALAVRIRDSLAR